MPFSLLPKLIFHKLTDVKPEFLRQQGVRLLMLDFESAPLFFCRRRPSRNEERRCGK